MKILTILLTLASLFVAPVRAATNLLVNGDFQTGVLTPWQATGTTGIEPIGDFRLASLGDEAGGGSIAQTIPTEVGKTYYLSTRFINLAAPFGVQPQFTLSVESNAAVFAMTEQQDATSDIYSLVFTAVATQTTVRLSATIGTTLVDDVSVILLPVSPFAGSYVGKSKMEVHSSVLGFEDEVLGKKTQRITARVFPTGQFVILRDVDRFAAGILFEDGTFALRSNNVRSTGTAQIKGRQIKLLVEHRVEDSSQPAIDEGHGYLPLSATLQFTLTRDGK